MADVVAAEFDDQPPINPYSLLEAVNAGSDSAHGAWLIFVGVMSYLLVAVAGVTHRDLLLNNDIELPMLQVGIELTRFFLFAPILLVLFHMGLVSQLTLVARKALELDNALRLLEPTGRRNHALRLELHNFFLVQLIAGPERSRLMGALLHTMCWLTIVVLPLVLIVYVQLAFLPYHSQLTTTAHRLVLVADMLMLITIGVFTMRPETSFVRAFLRTLRHHPFSVLATAAVLVAVTYFSFLAATIPDGALDRISRTWRRLPPADITDHKAPVSVSLPFVASAWDLSVFPRNLVVTDLELGAVRRRGGGNRLSLRERDLRYATLDRSDLAGTDLTAARLEGASLVDAKLDHALFGCVAFDKLLVPGDRDAARCVRAAGARFRRAGMERARMAGIDLLGADLVDANLMGAELAAARLIGAVLTGARLGGADLSGVVELQGASLLQAELHGANLAGARLHRADLSQAALQGASLVRAELIGASLRFADLEAAEVREANLMGADLTGARVRATDMRGVQVWQTRPPTSGVLLDAGGVELAAPSSADFERRKARARAIGDKAVRDEVLATFAALADAEKGKAWAASSEFSRWETLSARPSDTVGSLRAKLTEYLTKLMCSPAWSDGALALGVARRARDASFGGEFATVLARLTAQDCPGGRKVPERIVRELSQRLDATRAD